MDDFNGSVSKATRIVCDAFPRAKLGEITFRSTGVAHVVDDLTHWHFVYSLENGRAVIACEAGRFTPPAFLDGLLVGDLLLHLPIRKTLADAFSILRSAGVTGPVECVILRHDLNLGPSGSQEPHYQFAFPGSLAQVLIGSDTGAVTRWSPAAR